MLLLAAVVLASCNSDNEDPLHEAREKTELLRKEYNEKIVGSWHYEYVHDTQRFYELLTFLPDGTLTGWRIWQTRRSVVIDGQQQYTDWEDLEQLHGTFKGEWSLRWERDSDGNGANRLFLRAEFDDSSYMAYSHILLFDYADETTLRFSGFSSDGWRSYQCGDDGPSF